MYRLASFFVAILLFGGGWLLLSGSLVAGESSGKPADKLNTSAPAEESSEQSSDCDPVQSVGVALIDMGFDDLDFVVGASAIDWDIAQMSHVDQAFSPTPIQSKAELRDFLQADTAASATVRGLLGYTGPASMKNWWVPVQFTVPIVISGNNHWDGSDAVKYDEDLLVLAGDVWWFDVSRSGCGIDPTGSIRAACGNVGFDLLNPARRNE